MRSIWKIPLILSLGFALLLSQFFTRDDRGSKGLTEYWAETELSPNLLTTWVNDSNCWSDERLFLSCVNSLRMMGRWRKAALDTSGRWIHFMSPPEEFSLTEKEEMHRWKSLYSAAFRKIAFSGLFAQIWSDELWREPLSRGERNAMLGSGLNGFLSVAKDPHTYVIPKRYYEEVVSQHLSRSMSFGFVAKLKKGKLIVRKVLAGSSAEISGMQRGDRILEINSTNVREFLPHELQDWNKFLASGRASLKIERFEEGRREELMMEVITTPEVLAGSESKMLDSQRGIGLLTIHKFGEETCAFVREDLKNLVKQGLRGLLVDLRDNPGGHMEEAICVAGLFLKKGTPILESRYLNSRTGHDKYVGEEVAPLYEGAMAILINSGSASAAEIVAGALRDMGRAKLVGERTFGKGSFQDGRVWEYADSLILFETEGLYYFPSGWTPQVVGIQPDIPISGEIDEVLREKDLYYSALRPMDEWAGPQSALTLTPSKCKLPQTISLDRQVSGAADWLSCASLSLTN